MLRRFAIIVGVVLFAVLLWRLGPATVLSLASRIGWSAVLVLLLYLAHDATRALALAACVVRPGLLRFGDAFAIRLAGDAVESLTFTGPMLAEPTRAWLLTRRGLALTEGFAATITEYLVCSLVGAIMSIAALVYLVQHFHTSGALSKAADAGVVVLTLFLAAAAIAIWKRFYLIGTILGWLSRLGVLRGRLRPDIAAVNEMEHLLLVTLHDNPVRLALVAFHETMSQACLVLELFVLMHAVADVPLGDAFVMEGAMKIVATVFLFVPLQIGVAEGSYAALFSVMGLPAAAGFAVVLLRRARSICAAGAGLAVLAVLSRQRTRVSS